MNSEYHIYSANDAPVYFGLINEELMNMMRRKTNTLSREFFRMHRRLNANEKQVKNITNFIMSNGMTAEEFAIFVIRKNHKNRQIKSY